MQLGKVVARSSRKVQRGEQELHALHLSEHEVPCPITFNIEIPREPYGPLEVYVESAEGEKVLAVPVRGSKRISFILHTLGEYKVKVRNTREYELEIKYVLSRMKVEKLLSMSTSYYKVRRLGKRSLLITDGEKLLVKKDLAELWRILGEEKFSGVLAWLDLNSQGNEAVPKLLQLNTEYKYLVYEYVEGKPFSLIVKEREKYKEEKGSRPPPP